MKAIVRKRGYKQWEVWIVLDRMDAGNGYCVGVGETRDAAIIDAVHDLYDVAEQLGAMR